MLVFTDGAKRSIEGVYKIFEDFAAMSGLKISGEINIIHCRNFNFARGEIFEQISVCLWPVTSEVS